MLVLTRRLGQKLIISDKITVSVVSVGRGRVQLGIEAPRDISVRRIASDLPNSEGSDGGSERESTDEETEHQRAVD